MSNMSRRAVLKFATIASAAVLVSELSSIAPAMAATLPQVESHPGAISAYLKTMRVPRNLTISDVMTLEEIKAEYHNAVAIFPLVLPDGGNFPRTLAYLVDPWMDSGNAGPVSTPPTCPGIGQLLALHTLGIKKDEPTSPISTSTYLRLGTEPKSAK